MVIKKTSKITFIILTLFQTVLACIWGFKNITVIPDTVLSKLYIEASNTLVTDEFMSTIYTRIIRFISSHTSKLSSTAIILYLFQIGIVVVAAMLFARAVSDDIIMSHGIVFFIVTNPFVLSTCMQISVSSIHFALLLSVVSLFVQPEFFTEKGASPGGVERLVKWLVAGLIFAGVIFLNVKCADTDAYGRCERTVKNYELQRFVWPHFGEINYTYVMEQSGFDTSNVSSQYLTSYYLWDDYIPSLKEHYGEYYKDIVNDYLKDYGITGNTRENVIEWGKDILSYFFAPVTVILNRKGYGYSYTGMLYDLFTENSSIASLYWKFSSVFSVAMTVLGFLFSLGLLIYRKVKRKFSVNPLFNKFTVCSVLLTGLISLYCSFFTFRGFDFRNALWCMIIWPLLFVVSIDFD